MRGPTGTERGGVSMAGGREGQSASTVFGKHCQCNAQKCTHLKHLPPLARHLLLLSHCVLTQHEGQKKSQESQSQKKVTCLIPGIERTTHGLWEHASVRCAIREIELDGS